MPSPMPVDAHRRMKQIDEPPMEVLTKLKPIVVAALCVAALTLASGSVEEPLALDTDVTFTTALGDP